MSEYSGHAEHIGNLFAAELQSRLASAVRLVVNLGNQPLDLPTEWTHGTHRVRYDEIALRPDQAEVAAILVHQSATYMMAVAVKDAVVASVENAKNHTDRDISGAYQIARLIRNAFAHGPFNPKWSIDPDCQKRIFVVEDVMTLDTSGLDKVALDWRHYGGPLALLRLCRFVRFKILKDPVRPRKDVPPPHSTIYQVGDLILQRVDQIPPTAQRIDLGTGPDGRVHLGGGYFVGGTVEKPAEN